MSKLLNNKILIIVVAVFIIVFLIIYGYYKINSRNFDNIKIDKSKYLVYTKEVREADNYIQEIPYVNIKGSTGKSVNNDIVNYLNNYTDNNIATSYEYSINGIVLSLILKVYDHSKTESSTISSYRAYNINLDTLELLGNEVIFNYLEVDEDSINDGIGEYLNNYYDKLVNKSIINKNECDYNCFLESRDIKSDNYTDNVEYFIRDGKLIIFKPMVFIPLYDGEELDDEFKIE